MNSIGFIIIHCIDIYNNCIIDIYIFGLLFQIFCVVWCIGKRIGKDI